MRAGIGSPTRRGKHGRWRKPGRAANPGAMKPTRLLLVSAILVLAGCGSAADLKPAPGQPLPVKPLMARTTPTANDLLELPPYAKPDRVDELVKRSQPRKDDPFELPPPTGGSAPTMPAGSNPQPATNETGPAGPGN
ncbi:MAG TPA: hypothetical protein VFK19_02950 [Sphingomicrobium sp.]|nr:hypothetical protein [Sphingomicrobium sp.]